MSIFRELLMVGPLPTDLVNGDNPTFRRQAHKRSISTPDSRISTPDLLAVLIKPCRPHSVSRAMQIAP